MVEDKNIPLNKEELAKRFTSTARSERKRYATETMVVVVVNKNGEVLLLTENTQDSRFGRERGQLNFISETRREGQGVRDNFFSALGEELGVDAVVLLRLIPGSYHEAEYQSNHYPNRSLARIVVLRYMGNPNSTAIFKPDDPQEITGYRWVNPDELDYLDLAPSVMPYLTQLQIKGLIRPHVGEEVLDRLQNIKFKYPQKPDILRL